MSYKLGRRAPNYMTARPWLEDHMTSVPPAWERFKPVVDYATGVQFPMYENDIYGDCTIAGMGHLLGAVTKYAKGSTALFTNDVITQTYEANCPGFDPVNDRGDNGCVMSTVLQYMVNTGMEDVGGDLHKVAAFAQLKEIGPRWLSCVLDTFGSVYIGVNLPESAQQQFSQNQPWTYVQGSPIEGGHCIVLQAVHEDARQPDRSGPDAFTFVTWGATQTASWQWCRTYIEEAWVVLTPDWIEANGESPSGFDLAQLQEDVQYFA